jgi:hypothetical protein
MVMVKASMPPDVVRRVKKQFRCRLSPTPGQWLESTTENRRTLDGWLDHDAVMIGNLLAFKRAGADGVLTCTALDAALRRRLKRRPGFKPFATKEIVANAVHQTNNDLILWGQTASCACSPSSGQHVTEATPADRTAGAGALSGLPAPSANSR